jgi:CubicO group peptidase (beta-lactamase class C family)
MSSFKSKLPKTSSLLDSAQPETFSAYACGVLRGDDPFVRSSNCGESSLFDLASLTKVLSTTTLIAIAEEKKLLSIEDPVQRYFPKFPGSQVRLSHLLYHASGLPDWLPLHNAFHTENARGTFDPRKTPAIARAEYERRILESWIPERFENTTTYSDLGFLLLGWALEKAASAPLDALFQEWLVHVTGLDSLQFLPTTPDVVPTENCPWRGHVLRGEVHDDNTFVLGGIAGHAGLFGNLRDVLELAKLWRDALLDRAPQPLIKTETAKRYWKRSPYPGSVRSLGWDGITPGSSSSGRFFSTESTRGHLGFTGTSLWIDPEKDLIVTLLTNRVYPTRTNEKIKLFRPLFHDTLLAELGFGTYA